jgi:proline iminopeptidase
MGGGPPDPRPRHRNPLRNPVPYPAARRVWVLLRAGAGAVAPAVAGLLALAAAAWVSAEPAIFLGAGLAVFAAATGLWIVLATRGIADRHDRRNRMVARTVFPLGAVALFSAAFVLPGSGPPPRPAPVAGQNYWQLPTGSRIGYVHLPAHGTPRPTPVVVLHGGPGIADMAGAAAYFGKLTRDGFDVYVYDQAGTGHSARLADPGQYTMARAVADLEAIRGQIGADRVVLIGHSWGAQVAASYLASHGRHVERAVFSSPGALAPALADGSEAGVRSRLTAAQQLDLVDSLLLRPRALLAATLLQVSPRAAHALAGDAELDAVQDRVYNQARPALHCRAAQPGPAQHGLGFYAHHAPQSAASQPWADPRPQLARQATGTPALIIKGSCDYLSWSSAAAYQQALPHAGLVYLRGAGHNAYQDQPAAFLASVRAFLTGQPLPVAPWTSPSAPADYEGPR